MIIKNIIKSNLFYLIICITSVVLTLTLTLTGVFVRESYNISVGSVSPKKFIAPEAIVNEVRTNKLIEDAKSTISPLYTHNPKIQEKVVNELNLFFEQTEAFINSLKQNELSSQESGNTPDEYLFQSLSPALSENGAISSKVYLNQNQIELLKSLTAEEFLAFKKDITLILSSILEQGVREDSDKSSSFIKEELSTLDMSEDLKTLGYYIISSVIEPNLIVDTEATEKAKENKAAEVEPIMILKSQKIIDEGEIIDEEVYSILEDLGYVKTQNLSENIIRILGVSIFTILILLIIFFYINTHGKRIKKNKNEIALLFALYCALIFCVRFLMFLPYMFLPILTFTLLVSLLLEARLAIVLNVFVTLISFVMYNGDLQFVFYFILTGTTTVLISNNLYRKNKIMLLGFCIILINAVSMLGLTLFFDNNWQSSILSNLLFSVISSFLALIICIGSLPIWESLFGIVTSLKMLDLINPDKELLKKLLIEAPGTYHHSLIVANLAEAAAYDLGVDVALTRVGAYYHDIGKLDYPQYFSENMNEINPHDNIDPHRSATILFRHVEAGLEFADEYKLPPVIKDIIHQHHGNTIAKYFYQKAITQYSQEAVKESDFRYPCPLPQSKEAAIVMLADTVEAAVRSISPSGKKNLGEIESFVKKLINDKLTDDQLKESNLKIKELDIILKAFMRVFKGMFHERIAYPEEKKKDE